MRDVTVKVRIPTILRPHVGGLAAVEASGGGTLRDLLTDLEARYPGLTKSIVNGEGGLHRFINVYVNDEDVRYLGALDARVGEGDTVSILPAVAGGSLAPGQGCPAGGASSGDGPTSSTSREAR